MPGGATLKLPEFWSKEPALWFVTAEGQFATKGITAEDTKRAHVVAALPVEVASRVKDELLTPDTAAPYSSLKKRLLGTFTMNSYQRVCAIMDMPPRPNDRPTALLDAMLAYLPEGVSRDDPNWLFRGLFLRRLPSEIRAHLMDSEDEPVRALAERGDKLWSGMPAASAAAAVGVFAVDEEVPSPRASVTSPTPSIRSEDVCHEHHCCVVQGATSAPRRTLCFDHRKYGVRAKTCTKPCDWVPWKELKRRSGNVRGGYRN